MSMGHVCNVAGGSIKVTGEQIEVALRKIQGNTQEREFIQVMPANSRGSAGRLHMHVSWRTRAAPTTSGAVGERALATTHSVILLATGHQRI